MNKKIMMNKKDIKKKIWKIFPTFFYTTKSFLCAVVEVVVGVVQTVVFGCSHHIDYNDFVHYNIDYNRVDYNCNYSPSCK